MTRHAVSFVALAFACFACSGAAGLTIPGGSGASGSSDAGTASDAASGRTGATTAAAVNPGTRLLVAETPPPGSAGASTIFSVRSDGTDKTVLTNEGGMPSWTPDGGIVFVSSRSGSAQIWTMDDHGNDAKPLGMLPSNLSPFMPQLAKNGVVVFNAADPNVPGGDDHPGIWVMQRDGSGLRQITTGQQPFLAPSGTWIAYTMQTDVPYHRQIWRIDIDGTNARALTSLGDPDYPDANAPSISPDESTVAFFSGKESDDGPAGFTQSVFTFGHRNVGIVPAAGGSRKTLTPCKPVTTDSELQASSKATGNCLAADNPAWSPDGKWLIFDAGFHDGTETWMVSTTGDGFQRFYAESRGIVRVALKN